MPHCTVIVLLNFGEQTEGDERKNRTTFASRHLYLLRDALIGYTIFLPPAFVRLKPYQDWDTETARRTALYIRIQARISPITRLKPMLHVRVNP